MDYRMEEMPWQREATADWSERFEALARSKGVNDNAVDATHPTSAMTDLFLTLVGKNAYSHIKPLVAPERPSTMKFADLKAKIDTHLQPKTIEIAERYKFHQVKQGGSSVAAFVTKLRKAAETCNFAGQLDTSLRDCFVVGLDDENVIRKLLLEHALTFEKALQIASASEEVRNCQLARKTNSESQVSAIQHSKRSSGLEIGNKTEANWSPCKYCGNKHAKRNCPAYGKSCNKCGKKKPL